MTIKQYKFWKEVKMLSIVIPLGITLGLIGIELIKMWNIK